MKNNEFARDWLRRAKSNLERARVGKIKDEILYEDLCFDCQQSAEKALKALQKLTLRLSGCLVWSGLVWSVWHLFV